MCLFPVSAPAMQESVKRSMEYVAARDDDCVYGDGYRCLDVPEDDFLRLDPDRPWVPGPYLEAWAVSYRDFQAINEMSAAQKQLKHYKLGFSENDTQYLILYQGLMLPRIDNGEVTGVLRATFGLSTKYWIDKKTLEIDKRLFMR